MPFQIVYYEDAEMTAFYRDGKLVTAEKDDYLDSETILNLSSRGILVDKVDHFYEMSRDIYDEYEDRDEEPWPEDLATILPRLREI